MRSGRASIFNDNSWLGRDRSRPILKEPDPFYKNFIYEALRNYFYHLDIDSVVVDRRGKIIAIIEAIKGIDNPITPFKEKILPTIADSLNVPFYITNWSRRGNKVKVADYFAGTQFEQSMFEHRKWLRQFKGGKDSGPTTSLKIALRVF